MVGPSKVLPTTLSAQKPAVDLHVKTPGVEDDEDLKHELVIPSQAYSLALLVTHRANRLSESLKAALKSVLPKSKPDPRTRFHEQFRKEADEYDRDFHKKYHDDLNTILIFVSFPKYHILPPR